MCLLLPFSLFLNRTSNEEQRWKAPIKKRILKRKKKKKKRKRKRSSVVPCGFRVACVFPHIDRVNLRRRIREFCQTYARQRYCLTGWNFLRIPWSVSLLHFRHSREFDFVDSVFAIRIFSKRTRVSAPSKASAVEIAEKPKAERSFIRSGRSHG